MQLKGTATSFQLNIKSTDEGTVPIVKQNVNFQTLQDITIVHKTVSDESRELPEREIKEISKILYKSV